MPDVIYSVGATSSSCTYGNLIEFVHEDVMSKFPSGFFRYDHVSSVLAFRQMKKYMDNTENEIRKQEKPSLFIKPNFEVGDDNIAFRNTPLTWNVQSNPEGMSRKSILPFIKDTHRGYVLGYRLNRDKLSFDVTIHVETLTKQLDTYKALENCVGFGNPYTQYASLETIIPFQMVQYMGRIIKCDLDPMKPETIPPVMQYLQSHSNYPITYKIRNSTSNPEFFMYYGVPILITYSDLTIDDGSKKEMADDIYSITFRVSVEFNHPGAYVLIGADIPFYKHLNFQMHIDNKDSTDTFIPIYTMDRLFEEKDEVLQGYKMYTSTIVKTEEQNFGSKDYTDLTEIIEACYLPIIKKYNFSTIDMGVIFKIKLYHGKNVELVEDTDFIVDWSRMELCIINSDPNDTYRIIVYQNRVKCNEELQQIEAAKKNDKTYDSIYNPSK